ncbi:MAG: hypothetical protein HYT89_01755 [Candidatus Omnitrophica bacterium]|nr:hypothetical protein [Candidatus Omnitrophota bacterium]
MKIHIPNSAFLNNIDPFIRSFDPQDPESLQITSHPEWVSIHPLVLSMIASLGLNVKPENISINVESKSNTYLVRMGLYKMLGLSSPAITEHAPEGRFIPLTRVKTQAELDTFITDMLPILHKDQEQAATIGYVISELGRNVIEHSESRNGAILCAQGYPKSKKIRIGIADTGLGLKKTISRSHYAPNDLAALRLALWPGITGTTSKPGGTEQNAGAGLFFTRAIAHVNKDFFVIYSGGAFYKQLTHKTMTIHADPFESKNTNSGDMPHWQGTAVGVDISLDKTQQYDTLLAAIRKTYAAERKTDTPYKRPRFI